MLLCPVTITNNGINAILDSKCSSSTALEIIQLSEGRTLVTDTGMQLESLGAESVELVGLYTVVYQCQRYMQDFAKVSLGSHSLILFRESVLHHFSVSVFLAKLSFCLPILTEEVSIWSLMMRYKCNSYFHTFFMYFSVYFPAYL